MFKFSHSVQQLELKGGIQHTGLQDRHTHHMISLTSFACSTNRLGSFYKEILCAFFYTLKIYFSSQPLPSGMALKPNSTPSVASASCPTPTDPF